MSQKNNSHKRVKKILKKFLQLIKLDEVKQDQNSIDSAQYPKNHPSQALALPIEYNAEDFEDADDNDQNFIIIDGKKKKRKISAEKESKVNKIIDDLIKFKPENYQTNQQRNLDRETGGVEQEKTYTTNPLDVWDSRPQEIEEMADIDPQDYNSDDKASMIWDKKRKKKQQQHIAENSGSKPTIPSTPSKNNGGRFF
ncbi:MAG: hypothetical protein ACKO47_00295 [Alphaproteobacteria bacterium]